MSQFRLTVAPPDGNLVRKDWMLTHEVSAYGAMVILTGADPAVAMAKPISYPDAREFAQNLIKTPPWFALRHRPTGITFMIERTD